MMTRRIKQISPLTRIEIEEDTRDDDNPFFETSLEEVEAVRDGFGEAFEVEPEVEGAVWDGVDDEAHFAETADYIVAFGLGC